MKKIQTKKQTILLVGAGYMATEYAKVLKALRINFVVIGRGEKSAREFTTQTKTPVIQGGLEKWLNENESPSKAIVASTEDAIGKNTLSLLQANTKEILVEKPGGFDFTEIKKIARVAKQRNAKVYVGYNRRFYASVTKALEIIKQDKGVTSFYFDFSELGWKMPTINKSNAIKNEWFLHNSTHLIDLAFYLCGWPTQIESVVSGEVSWHKRGTIFVGMGKALKNTPFSYGANWLAPGRWSIEVMTKKHKLVFKPLEKLQIQELGSFEVKELKLKDKLDLTYKPGLYKQVQSFLGTKSNICTIDEQVKNLVIYNQILTGTTK